MLKFAAIAILVPVAGILVYAGTRPDRFRVERSLAIHAPASTIFPFVNDLHRHLEWSPWEQKDPAMKRAHSGAAAGEGAVYEWDGNKNIGRGRMEIVESLEPRRVRMKLDFLAPFEAHNTAEFLLEPDGDATRVTWAMDGPQTYMGKVIGLFMNMDRMIGGEFENGLASLRTLSEAGS